MKQVILRLLSISVLLYVVRYYPPFGDGGFMREAMNIIAFMIVFVLADRLIEKIR